MTVVFVFLLNVVNFVPSFFIGSTSAQVVQVVTNTPVIGVDEGVNTNESL